jgi:DNA replication protein DnaC
VLTLPSLPAAVRVLDDAETRWLRDLYPDLPMSLGNCVTCKGATRFRWLDDAGQPADYECNCADQFLAHRFLLNAGIELHYQRLRWDDADGIPPDALSVIEDYIAHVEQYVATGLGLVLWGTFGTGKTLASALLLKAVLGQGTDGFFTTMHTLLDRFTEGWEKREAATWFNFRIRNAGLLVIDDIGREHAGRNAVAESTLDHVLRSRVASDRPTIITTNRTPEELVTLYARQAMSLITESTIMHEFRGTDFRPENQTRRVREARQGLVRPITFGA